MKSHLKQQLEILANKAISEHKTIATAESLTGGGIAAALTELSGSSEWFVGGIVTYNNTMKHKLLQVSAEILSTKGAVCAEVVTMMTAGVLKATDADLAVAVSGVAGPTGGTEENPVGSVWIAWQIKGQQAITEKFWFAGDRAEVRAQTVQQAVVGLIGMLG